MYERKTIPNLNCGLDLIGEVLYGKWKIRLLWFIDQGHKRPSELQRKIPDASQRAQIEAPVKSFVEGLREDRKSLVLGDLLRTLLFCAVAGAAVFAAIKQKINPIIFKVIILSFLIRTQSS